MNSYQFYIKSYFLIDRSSILERVINVTSMGFIDYARMGLLGYLDVQGYFLFPLTIIAENFCKF